MSDIVRSVNDYLGLLIEKAQAKGYLVENIDARGSIELRIPGQRDSTIVIHSLFAGQIIDDFLMSVPVEDRQR